MAAIRHTLLREVFQPSEERLVGVVHVTKASKKKKISILCAAVSQEKPINVYLYQVKKSDKDVYKKRNAWNLRELKSVDGRHDNKDLAEFDLHFDRVYKWNASNAHEKWAFISCLWKLVCRHLPRQKPSFVNVPSNLLEESILSGETETVLKTIGDDVALEAEDYQALSEKEETDLEKLMSQCEVAISDADDFVEQLSRDLSILDGANVHTIMASEEKVQHLMDMIQMAIDEATKIETNLDSYDDTLKNVRENMEKIEEKNLLIQIQNTNNRKLCDELENLVTQLDLAHNHQMALLDGNLASGHLADCNAAAKALHKTRNAQIDKNLLKMSAVQDQMKLLEKLSTKFTNRLSRHLNNLFIHLGNDQGENLNMEADEPTMARHTACHKDLLPYHELMWWLKVTNANSHSQLSKVYTGALCKRYEREIHEFFEVANQLMAGRPDRDRKVVYPGKDSSQDLAVKGGGGKMLSPMFQSTEKEQFGSELEISERQKFDKLLERILSELEPVCLAEQQFCVQLFHLTSDSNQAFSAGDEGSSTSQKKEKQINEEVRRMMGELFAVLEPELMNFIHNYDKTDCFASMFLLVRLSQHVMSAQDTGSFLSMTFANALVHAKRNFDKFMQVQIRSIEETKVAKKTRCGILPFVSNFEEFAQQAEAIFKGSDRRIDLEKWYVKLVHAMMDAVPRIAKEHQKTPHQVIIMENFHHLYALLSQLKISCLDSERKEAKQKYNEQLQAYVTRYFGRPLEKLNNFFDGIQAKVAQGVKEEEVGYQLAFSKQELRKVIKEYPGKEVKKGLDTLYKIVEKHLCEEENLLQVVWHSMQDEFIRQYKYIEGLINRCYPGSLITLEFSINDILQFFSDIARSH